MIEDLDLLEKEYSNKHSETQDAKTIVLLINTNPPLFAQLRQGCNSHKCQTAVKPETTPPKSGHPLGSISKCHITTTLPWPSRQDSHFFLFSSSASSSMAKLHLCLFNFIRFHLCIRLYANGTVSMYKAIIVFWTIIPAPIPTRQFFPSHQLNVHLKKGFPSHDRATWIWKLGKKEKA